MIGSEGIKYLSLSSDHPIVCKIIEFDEEHVSCCYAYKRSVLKTILYVLLCILTGGFQLLISYWKPNWELYLTHIKCPLSTADKVLLVDQYGTCFVENIKTGVRRETPLMDKQPPPGRYRYFWHKHLKYYYDHNHMSYMLVQSSKSAETLYNIYEQSTGISQETRNNRLSFFGANKIDIEIKSYLSLFFEECADPFYIFQVFSCALWFSDDYYYYAAAIVFISLTSIFISIIQTRKHLQTLHNMIAQSTTVSVIEPDGNCIEISSEYLVPGDVLSIPKTGGTLLCDAVLLTGTVIVNESMLTGESIPVTKTTITRPTSPADATNEVYNALKHKRNTLFCGTQILQTRYYGNEHVKAVVVKTGFTTMKGGLIRSILYPKPVDFQFFSDAMKFVGVLGVFALFGLGLTIYCFVRDKADVADIVKKGLDVITIAVPPALPAAMSVGTVYALQRLKKKSIFCISPSRVNISGKVKLFCFDKTGTLTEDCLNFCGIIRSTSTGFTEIQESLHDSETDEIIVCMATCHSLTVLNGKICGDPLDEKMFHATNWELEEAGSSETERYENIVSTIVHPKSSAVDSIRIKYTQDQRLPLEVAVMKQFTFSSELQRMSVIIRRLGSKNMEVFAKGSPEMINSLCKSSTIPPNFEEMLVNFTKQGYRVLALASKPLEENISWHRVQHFQRNMAETDLHFLGFIVFKNVLKPETQPIIEQLYESHIRPVMVTGDNLLTAVSVGRECGMVKPCEKIISISLSESLANNQRLVFHVIGELDHYVEVDSSNMSDFNNSRFLQRNYHLAVTGKVFAVIQSSFPSLYEKLLVCGTIFSRMLPDQKAALVEGLQELGYGVGMCGDGANDCGALKRAHTGISLSEAEASIASPFTSKIPNISCVIDVIKEGRCALVTSFNIFKYMALYSMIQYTSVLMLYNITSNLGDFQFLYIDLFIIMPIAITMSRTGPSDKLDPVRPLGRLVHPLVLFSLISQILTQTAFQVLIYFYVPMLASYRDINTFKPSSWHPGQSQIKCFENSAIFILSSFQYVILAVIFSVGKPHRKELYTNYAFLSSLLVFTGFNVYLTLQPCSFLQEKFELLVIKDSFYDVTLFGLVACNFMVSYIIDNVLLKTDIVRKYLKMSQCKRQPRNRYKVIRQEILCDKSWPPTGVYSEKTGAVC